MATVVNSENLVEFISTGKVPEFKAPDAKPAVTVTPESSPQAKTNGASGDSGQKVGESGDAGKARGSDGKFLPADKAGAKPAGQETDDPDDVELPERVRRQIGKKHRQMKEAEEFAASEARRAIQAEQRARELEEQLRQARGGKSAGQETSAANSDDDPEPDQKDFKTVGDYAKALTKWEVRQEAKRAREAGAKHTAVAQEQQEAQVLAKAFEDRQTEFMKTCPDYEAVMEDCDLDMHNAGMQYLIESEVGPQLAYWLSKPENQHHITRINKLSPVRIAAELGKLEDKLGSQQQQQTEVKPADQKSAPAPAASARQVSKAPAPIEPLSADASASQGQKDPSQMSFAELRAHRQAEAAKKGRRL